MINIKVKMKDGSRKDFPHRDRAGGSYSNSVRYEGVFVIIRDVYGNETSIPAADVAEVQTTNLR